MKFYQLLLLSFALPVIATTASAAVPVDLSELDLDATFISSAGTAGVVSAPIGGTSQTHSFTVSGLDIAEDGTANDEITFSYDVASINGDIALVNDTEGESYGVDGAADPPDNEIDLDEGLTFSNLTAAAVFGDATSETLIIVSANFTGFFTRFPGGGDVVNLTTIDDNAISSTPTPNGGPNDPYNFDTPQSDFKVISGGGNGFGVDNISAAFILSTTAEQNFVWDGTDFDGDANGGSGSWDVGTTSNWDDVATGGSDVVWVNGGNAVFGGDAAGTVTLEEPVTANTLSFELAGYEISMNTLTVDGGSPEILVNEDATISSSLAGTTAVTKSGIGTLSLTGNSSGFTGGLTVADGRVDIDGAIGSAVTVSSILGGEGDISGNLTLEDGSTLPLIIDDGDALNVTGDVIIDGVVQLDLDMTPSGDITILTYGGSVTGNLTDLVPPGRGTVVDTGTALVLQNTLSQNITWNAVTSDNWEVAGSDENWDSSDGLFFNGDSVSFTDVVDPQFGGAVAVSGSPEPTTMTVNNSTIQPYTFTGTPIGGTGGLTKSGDGMLTLASSNTFTGGVTVNDGTLELAAGGPTGSTVRGEVTVNEPGTLLLSATNALGFTVGAKVDTVNVFDGASVDHNGGADNGFGVEWNLRGSTIQTINATAQFSMAGGSSVNSLADADSSVIAGRVTVRQNPVPFNVEDGAAETDLLVSADLVSQGGGTLSISKSGDGIMLLSGTNDTQNWGTTVTGGCLLLDSIASIPSDLTQVSVAADAGFGGIVGAANLLNADITGMVANVAWDGSGDAFLVLDTNGANVTVSSNIVGDFKLLKKGAGDLTLTGTVSVNDTVIEAGNVILDPGGDVLIIDSITTAPGTNSGVMVTIAFTAGSNVDVYASDDLINFGTPIATGVSVSPFVQDDIAGSRRFYVLVTAGETFP